MYTNIHTVYRFFLNTSLVKRTRFFYHFSALPKTNPQLGSRRVFPTCNRGGGGGGGGLDLNQKSGKVNSQGWGREVGSWNLPLFSGLYIYIYIPSGWEWDFLHQLVVEVGSLSHFIPLYTRCLYNHPRWLVQEFWTINSSSSSSSRRRRRRKVVVVVVRST